MDDGYRAGQVALVSVKVRVTMGHLDFPVRGMREVKLQFEIPEVEREAGSLPEFYEAGTLMLHEAHAEGFVRVLGGHSFGLVMDTEVEMA